MSMSNYPGEPTHLNERIVRLLDGAAEGLTVSALTKLLNRQAEAILPVSQRQVLLALGQDDRFVTHPDHSNRYLLWVEQVRQAAVQPKMVAPSAAKLTWARQVIAERGFVLFDLEATSRDPAAAQIIEIAAHRWQPDGGWQPAQSWLVQLPAGETLPADVEQLTGITPTDLLTALPATEALAGFIDYADGALLVAHNGAVYDGPLLHRHLLASDLQGEQYECTLTALQSDYLVDSLHLAYLVLPTALRRDLSGLYQHYATKPLTDAHRAAADVEAMKAVLFHDSRSLMADLRSWRVELTRLIGALLAGADWPGLALLETMLPQQFQPPYVSATAATTRSGELLAYALNLPTVAARLPPPVEQPPRKASQPLDVGRMVNYFGKDGELARLADLGGKLYEARQAQADMVQAVGDGLNAGTTLLVEAGTGIGKTRAYLYPLIRHATHNGLRAMVSTHTRSLQDQLLGELRDAHQELREVSDGREWGYAVLKGMSNYLCLRKLDTALEDEAGVGSAYSKPEPTTAPTDFFRCFSLAILVSWATSVGISNQQRDDQSAEGYFEELRLYGWERYSAEHLKQSFPALVASLAAQRGDCSKSACPLYKQCFYYGAVTQAQGSTVVVVNHALLISEARNLPTADLLVCDEAHTLEDAATDALTIEFTATESRAALYEIRHKGGQRSYGGVLERASREFRFSLREEGVGRTAVAAWSVAEDSLGKFQELLLDFLRTYARGEDEDAAARYGCTYPLTSTSVTRRAWIRVDSAGRELATRLTDLAIVLLQLRPAGDFDPDNLSPRANAVYLELGRLHEQLKEMALRLKMVLGRSASPIDKVLKPAAPAAVKQPEPVSKAEQQQAEQVAAQAKALALNYVYTAVCGPLAGAEGERLADWSLQAQPIEVGSEVAERVLAYNPLQRTVARPTILTTATATVGGSFDFAKRRLGLYRLDEHHLLTVKMISSDFDYKNRALFLLPSHLHQPRQSLMTEFKRDVADTLATLTKIAGGQTLALFTARERLTSVGADLRQRESMTAYRLHLAGSEGQSSASRAEEIDNFKRDPGNAVLMGVRGLWEGLDVPKPGLRVVTMSKLPFPLLGDPLIAARMERVRDAGGDSFSDYYLPLAVLLFKQGFGRLMRRTNDRGVVLLLDTRIRRAFYRDTICSSLPRGLNNEGPTIHVAGDEDRYVGRGEESYRKVAEWLGAEFDPAMMELASATPVQHAIDEFTLNPDDLANFRQAVQQAKAAGQDVAALLRRTDWQPAAPILTCLRGGLKAIFGHDDFRPHQQAVMLAALCGEDGLAVLPTGSGKSVCFQLPALLRPAEEGLTIVISPLVALMKDQVDRLRDAGILQAHFINNTQSASEREEIISKARNGGLRLLYISPERLREPRVRHQLLENADLKLAQIVVDEAHCVSLWGNHFRPDFLEVANCAEQREQKTGQRPALLALTATATLSARGELGSVLNDIKQRLHMRGPLTFTASFDRPELRFLVYRHLQQKGRKGERREKLKDATLLRVLRGIVSKEPKASVVIYCAYTRTTVRLAALLNAALSDHSVAVRAYHGKLEKGERSSVQEAFMNETGGLRIVVATKAFGMGIDKDDVRYVIHYDLPASMEDYYQEAGRGGRDGNPAWAVAIWHDGDKEQDRLIDFNLPSSKLIIDLYNYLLMLRKGTFRKGAEEEGAKYTCADKLYFTCADLARLLDEDGRDMEQDVIRTALYWLMKEGLVERAETDLSRANFDLRTPLADVQAAIRAGTIKLPDRVSTERACKWLEVISPLFVNRRLDLLAATREIILLAGDQKVEPLLLQSLLLAIDEAGHAIFRPFDQTMVLTVRDHNNKRQSAGQVLAANPDPYAEYRATANQRLADVRAYAADQSCRRRYILRYFDPATADDDLRCGRCDNCAEAFDVPWHDINQHEADVDLERAYDIKPTILRAVYALQPNKRGRFNLCQMLRGEEYITAKYNGGGPQQLDRALLASPYFGSLKHAEAKKVDAAIDELIAAGLLGREQYRVDNNVIVLTEAGQSCLSTGRYPPPAKRANYGRRKLPHSANCSSLAG